VLQTVACQSPVLLVLDDLHWAGRPTLALLKHLQVTAPPMALLVLATYRDPGIPPGHALTELLGDLHREPGVERIVLGGLGEPQVRELVETTIGHELSPAVAVRVAELCRETDGNPFFLAETVRALQESGAVSVDADGRWVQLAAFELPGSVREVIRGRIARLGERGAHLLRHAAVIGREFDLGLLAEVAKVQPDAALDELERAELAAIVAEQPDAPGGYAFVHALVKHAVEDQLSTSRRARVHRRVAEALEQRSGEDDSAIGDLARHWAAADGLNARAKASHYAVLAGRAALAQLAPDAALAWFRRAMALHDAGPEPAASESLELLLGLGEAQLHAGHPEFRETLLEAGRTAQLVGDNERLVRAALANSRGYFSSAGVVDDQRVAVLQAALDGTAPEDPCRARLLALLAAELIWSPEHERRSALCDEALALARAREDPAALAHVLTMRVTAVWWPETLQDRLAVTAELLERSETLSDPVQRFWALVWRAVTVAQSGEVAEADRCHAAMHELTERLRHPRLDFVLATQDGWRAQLAGRLEEAERLAGRALEIGTLAGEPDAQSLYAAQLCPLRWQQGRLAELAEALGAITQAVPGVSAFRALRALSEYEAGRPDGARSLLRDEAQGGFSGLSHDPVMLGALTLWGELAARAGEDPISAVLLARVEPLREQVVLDSLGALGAVSRTAGLLAASLGLGEAADAHFAHALGLHERFHASSLAARTRLEWGLAMVGREGRGESARGRDLLQSALTVAAGHGLAGLEGRCRAALDRPPQAPPPAVGPATRRAAAARRG
jgi:hypothetical protein